MLSRNKNGPYTKLVCLVLEREESWFHYRVVVWLPNHVRLSNPIDYCMLDFPVHYLPESAQTPVHWVGDTSNHLILGHPLLPSIFPRISIFSNESALRIRWLQYWNFSFNISPSNEYSGLISFRIDWFDLLADQGTLESLHQHHKQKHQFFGTQPSSSHICTWLLEKP